jgi:hypothetical protein
MWIFLVPMNRIGDGMDSVLASCVIDRGFEPLSGQTKDTNKKHKCAQNTVEKVKIEKWVSEWVIVA